MIKMSSVLNFAVLGSGFMGKKHIEIIKNLNTVHLNAVIDHHSQEHLENSYATYPQLEAFIEQDTDTDVVVIATPNYLHFEQARELLLSGYHVIIEKPFCMSVEEAEILEQVSLQSGKSVFMIMQNRYAPISVWLKNLVSSEILGDIYLVQTNCFWNRNENYYLPKSWKGSKNMDGGTLFTQFTHFADLIFWIFGDIENVHSRLKTLRHKNLSEIEDTGIATFDFVKGGMGSISFTTAAYDKNLESSMTIVAENGNVKISGQYFDTVEVCHIKDYLLDPTIIATPDNMENLKQEYHSVTEVLQHGKPGDISFHEGKKLIAFLENVYKTCP